jgi:ParB/RepB/Spo0J family partition protein
MTAIKQMPVDQIIRGDNDRTVFDAAALDELASSIKEYGLAQPITVRPVSRCTECGTTFGDDDTSEFCSTCGGDTFDSLYQIVAGERRFRACSQVLELAEVPVIVNELNNEQASAIMLAENVARADLDPIDEARAYQSRMDAFGWTVKEVAKKAGVSSVRVQFRVKLLRLRDDLQRLVRDGQIPIGYAQILSDGDLDRNRQLMALGGLRDNPSPTPAWFRKVVGKLVEEQSQDNLFDTDAFFVTQEVDQRESVQFVEPAHPSTSAPPVSGSTVQDIIAGQVSFWMAAASEWEDLGKSFKRQECEAAAQALRLVSASI